MLASEMDKQVETGFVAGVFDLFHIGHLNLLRRAKERCHRLIAGVLDDNAASTKGKWPVIPAAERLAIVAAIRYVDEAVLLTMETAPKLAAWDLYHYDAFFSGDDWNGNPAWAAEEAALNARGSGIVYFPYTKIRSSTAIQEAVLPPRVNATRAVRVGGPAQGDEAGSIGFRYLFPFQLVEKGERVVLYGAGDVGGEYARQLAALGYCKVVAFADRNHAQAREFCGAPVWAPEALLERSGEYDRLVIASTRYYDNISAYLRQIGLPPERVV